MRIGPQRPIHFRIASDNAQHGSRRVPHGPKVGREGGILGETFSVVKKAQQRRGCESGFFKLIFGISRFCCLGPHCLRRSQRRTRPSTRRYTRPGDHAPLSSVRSVNEDYWSATRPRCSSHQRQHRLVHTRCPNRPLVSRGNAFPRLG